MPDDMMATHSIGRAYNRALTQVLGNFARRSEVNDQVAAVILLSVPVALVQDSNEQSGDAVAASGPIPQP